MDGVGLEGARLASNSPDYNGSLIVCHHLDAKYYGMARAGASKKEVVSELREHDIDYYLVWDDVFDHPALRQVRRVRTANRELIVYAVTGVAS